MGPWWSSRGGYENYSWGRQGSPNTEVGFEFGEMKEPVRFCSCHSHITISKVAGLMCLGINLPYVFIFNFVELSDKHFILHIQVSVLLDHACFGGDVYTSTNCGSSTFMK